VLKIWVNVQTRLRLKQAHCLIQIFPRFEPAALIGAHTHGTHSGAGTAVLDC
jgi:hypothetical protein